MDTLPPELILHIYQYIHPFYGAHLKRVCSSWRNALSGEDIPSTGTYAEYISIMIERGIIEGVNFSYGVDDVKDAILYGSNEFINYIVKSPLNLTTVERNEVCLLCIEKDDAVKFGKLHGGIIHTPIILAAYIRAGKCLKNIIKSEPSSVWTIAIINRNIPVIRKVLKYKSDLLDSILSYDDIELFIPLTGFVNKDRIRSMIILGSYKCFRYYVNNYTSDIQAWVYVCCIMADRIEMVRTLLDVHIPHHTRVTCKVAGSITMLKFLHRTGFKTEDYVSGRPTSPECLAYALKHFYPKPTSKDIELIVKNITSSECVSVIPLSKFTFPIKIVAASRNTKLLNRLIKEGYTTPSSAIRYIFGDPETTLYMLTEYPKCVTPDVVYYLCKKGKYADLRYIHKIGNYDWDPNKCLDIVEEKKMYKTASTIAYMSKDKDIVLRVLKMFCKNTVPPDTSITLEDKFFSERPKYRIVYNGIYYPLAWSQNTTEPFLLLSQHLKK